MLATLQPAFVRFGGESPRHQLVVLVDEHVLELDLDPGIGQERDMRVAASGKDTVATAGFLDFKDETVPAAYLVEFLQTRQRSLVLSRITGKGVVPAIQVRVFS